MEACSVGGKVTKWLLIVSPASEEGGPNTGIETQLVHAVPAPQVLKPGGRDEAVTSDNRLQFVHLAAEWHLGSRLGPPAEAFAQGLHEARRSETLQRTIITMLLARMTHPTNGECSFQMFPPCSDGADHKRRQVERLLTHHDHSSEQSRPCAVARLICSAARENCR